MSRQILHEIDNDSGGEQEGQHLRPWRRDTVFMGEPAVEGDGRAKESREGRDHHQPRVVEGRNAELDGEIGHAQLIAESQPARRDPARVMDRDGHEGSG